MLTVGSPATAFNAPDHTGAMRSLADYAGSWLVLYFYPQDETSGCTVEACGFRDRSAEFEALGAVVVGVSPDAVESHVAFRAAHQLPFTLLADPSKTMLRAYGAWGPKIVDGKETEGALRSTVLIDPQGIIAKIYPKVSPEEHPEQILRDLQTLVKA